MVEQRVLAYTSAWMGVVRLSQALDVRAFAESAVSAVDSEIAPYTSPLLAQTVFQLLEDIAIGIGYEKRIEGRRVTPTWWIHHLAGRELSRALITNTERILRDIRHSFPAPLGADKSQDPSLEALEIFGLLELCTKVSDHGPRVVRAIELLKTLRNEPTNQPTNQPTNDERWPVTDTTTWTLSDLRKPLVTRLASVVLQLPLDSHTKRLPDHFGRAYRVLFAEEFELIIEGDTDAESIFPKLLLAADIARARLVGDLSNEVMSSQVIFGTEPLVDVMELSGLALLMEHLDDRGIWNRVREVWSAVLDDSPGLTAGLVAVLRAHESNFSLSGGGIGRTERRMRLAKLMRNRGIENRDRMWSEDQSEPHPDPLVAAFAPDDMMGIDLQLADLFAAEYLSLRPESVDLEMSHGTQMVTEHLRRRREPE
jgi:hypothetical protein